MIAHRGDSPVSTHDRDVLGGSDGRTGDDGTCLALQSHEATGGASADSVERPADIATHVGSVPGGDSGVVGLAAALCDPAGLALALDKGRIEGEVERVPKQRERFRTHL